MRIAESKLTSQGQISVPAEVRRRLGLVPGGSIAWETSASGEIVVRRTAKRAFSDIQARFAHLRPQQPVSIEQMNEGIKSYVASRHSPHPQKRSTKPQK